MPVGRHADPASTRATSAASPTAGHHARRTAAATACADQHGDEHQQQAAADAEHGGQRSGDLADGEVGERHAAEGPASTAQLRKGPGAGQREPAPPPGRGGGHAGAEHPGVGRAGDHVAGRGEAVIQLSDGHEAAHGDEPAARRTGAPGRLVGDQPIEADQPDDREGPEAERRQRQAQRRRRWRRTRRAVGGARLGSACGE